MKVFNLEGRDVGVVFVMGSFRERDHEPVMGLDAFRNDRASMDWAGHHLRRWSYQALSGETSAGCAGPCPGRGDYPEPRAARGLPAAMDGALFGHGLPGGERLPGLVTFFAMTSWRR